MGQSQSHGKISCRNAYVTLRDRYSVTYSSMTISTRKPSRRLFEITESINDEEDI
jgi:hypothetical protein